MNDEKRIPKLHHAQRIARMHAGSAANQLWRPIEGKLLSSGEWVVSAC